MKKLIATLIIVLGMTSVAYAQVHKDQDKDLCKAINKQFKSDGIKIVKCLSTKNLYAFDFRVKSDLNMVFCIQLFIALGGEVLTKLSEMGYEHIGFRFNDQVVYFDINEVISTLELED